MDMEPEENQEPSPDGDEPVRPQPDEGPESTPPPESSEPQPDDALAQMRRALREEEDEARTRSSRGLRGFFQRLFHRKKPQEEETAEAPSRLDELQFPEPPEGRFAKPPAAGTTPPAEEAAPPPEPKPDFGTMVRSRLTDAFPEPEVREPTPDMQEPLVQEDTPLTPPPGQSILTSIRQEPGEPEEGPSRMREAALEGYVAEPEQAEEPAAPLTRDLRRSWRYMRPLERRLLIGVLVLVGLVGLGGIGYAVIKARPTPTPAATPTTGTTPYPISISLPGVPAFPLRTGFVGSGGQWNPAGAEWLSGTEVCRWISLPWNVQREAIIRTLKADDEIQLTMNNYESVIYKVKSIEHVPASDIGKLASDSSPCLLLILSQEKTNDRWVVTARP